MALQKSVVTEGKSTNRPPLFDGFNYPYWSTTMSIYIREIDYKMWDVITDQSFIPSTLNVVTNEMIPKPRSEWIEVETKRVQTNFKAINTLHCALTPTEINKVSSCTIAKQMEPGEDITSMLDRFTNITNKLSQLGKPIPEHEVVKSLLGSLPKNWKPKVIAIREAKDLNVITLDEICDSFLTHELELKEEKRKIERKQKKRRRASP
ncbi:hypothetical protein QQP08_019326 [Theobroma cacao]|nr:hypothetical protein QQP08_019326 [Theobroma cacao]